MIYPSHIHISPIHHIDTREKDQRVEDISQESIRMYRDTITLGRV
jgi:hypothetical protein